MVGAETHQVVAAGEEVVAAAEEVGAADQQVGAAAQEVASAAPEEADTEGTLEELVPQLRPSPACRSHFVFPASEYLIPVNSANTAVPPPISPGVDIDDIWPSKPHTTPENHNHMERVEGCEGWIEPVDVDRGEVGIVFTYPKDSHDGVALLYVLQYLVERHGLMSNVV